VTAPGTSGADVLRPRRAPRPTLARAWPAAEQTRGRRAAPASRLLIVSNRLPFTMQVEDGRLSLAPSSGGLATGLGRIHDAGTGCWIGWAGVASELLAGREAEAAARLEGAGAVGVPISESEVAGFYGRFANGVLWPVLHDQEEHPDPDPDDWAAYRAVNARFADVIAREARPGDRIWLHDYHLLLVPRLLRARRPDLHIGFFLHTPFPDAAALATLPQRATLLDGVLGADVLGFHTPAYALRFAEAVRDTLGRDVELAAGAGVVDDDGRAVQVHACPMGVDVEALEANAVHPRALALVANLRAEGGPLYLGVDRLDHTKGIPERLAAFERLLETQPSLVGSARLLQLAVPSREDVPAYRALRLRVESEVARINARFGTPAWTPIRYVYGSVDAVELAALYRAADVMLVTPLRDGMNLVAKEFVASRVDRDGVLVLSERAGAAAELREALLVDPTDVDGLARAYAAALGMSPAERHVRMRRLRARVAEHDVARWAARCVEHLATASTAARPR
jgi:trehalose 6-phosphate synthase/phosphatase